MRILQLENSSEIKKAMQDIGVDPYGIRIMYPKALAYALKLNSLSNIAANILKQEMLSLGADAAVCRGALTGKTRYTDCLLIGNLSQFIRLAQKLKKQPFGLNNLAADILNTISNYQQKNFLLKLGRYKLHLGRRTRIMGIMNLTPDSFSGDGIYQTPNIIDFARKMVNDGADIIDVGGESTRPGARPVSLKEELSRVIPAVKALSKKIKVPVSVDTYKPEVAKQALDNGAQIINDISGLRDAKMAKVISRYKAGVVIMHMRGSPRTMQNNPEYGCLIGEIYGYLNKAVLRAQDAGIGRDKIIVDPGIGFGKAMEHNLQILNRLSEFKSLGRPIMVGVSRKSFIGKILNNKPQERVFGSLAAGVLAAKNGADILRAHDVSSARQALRIADSINNIWQN